MQEMKYSTYVASELNASQPVRQTECWAPTRDREKQTERQVANRSHLFKGWITLAIHRLSHYPMDSVVCFFTAFSLDSDLSGG